MTQMHLFISGRVQGVGFRQFVMYHARKQGLTGWTRNLHDGRVEAVLQGEKHIIDQVVVHLRKGPFLSEVQEITVTEEKTEENFPTFHIKPTEESL